METKFTVCGWEDCDLVSPTHHWDFSSVCAAIDFLTFLAQHCPADNRPACGALSLHNNGVEMDRYEAVLGRTWVKVAPKYNVEQSFHQEEALKLYRFVMEGRKSRQR